MTALEKIFTSTSFLVLLGTLIIMVILYLIARLISARIGVNDLLRTAGKRIIMLKKVVRKVRVLCTEPAARADLAEGVKLLKQPPGSWPPICSMTARTRMWPEPRP